MWKHPKWLKMCNLKPKKYSNQKIIKLGLSETFFFVKSSDSKLNNKYFFSIFTFWKLAFFENLEKKFQNGPKYQIDAKNGKNHISTLYSFIFLNKDVIFWRWPFFSLFWHGITPMSLQACVSVSVVGQRF